MTDKQQKILSVAAVYVKSMDYQTATQFINGILLTIDFGDDTREFLIALYDLRYSVFSNQV